MSTGNLPEVWLRGAHPDVPVLLQPIAFALLQVREEVAVWLHEFPDASLWHRPAGLASVGFHLQHMAGVLDRMITYAAGMPLNDNQWTELKQEGKEDTSLTAPVLIAAFNDRVDKTISYLQHVSMQSLTEPREVGRGKLPSTVMGLLVHAAEHTTRHAGQLLVTAKVVKNAIH